jgi:hypothetical protein
VKFYLRESHRLPHRHVQIGRNTNAALTAAVLIIRLQADGDCACPVYTNDTTSTSTSTSTSTGQAVQTPAVLTVLTMTCGNGNTTRVVPKEKRGLAWNTCKIRSPHLPSKG